MKICTKCLASKPIDRFSKRSAAKDGVRDWCKECSNIYSKNYRLQNPEKVKADAIKYRVCDIEKSRESRRKSTKKYRLNNPEKRKEQQQKYSKANPEKNRDRYNARRARKLNNGVYKMSAKELERLYNSPCFYCGSTDSIQADHVIPLAKGGRHSIGNLVPACQKCNYSKGSKLLVEWKSA